MATDKSISVEDILQDLETSALDICKKGGQPQNEEEEFDNRDMIQILLKGKNPPDQGDCNKIAFDMLDWYTTQELTHTHNTKGEIVVKTINQVWARKGISTLSTKIKGAWSKLHVNEEPEEEVVETRKRGKRGGTFKERLVAGGKQAVTKALVRKASRNLTELGQQAIVGALMAGVTTDDPGVRLQIAQILKTDIGKALVAGALSMAIDHLPIPGLSEDNKMALIEELQTEAVDQVTMPLENIAKMAIPMLTGALTPLLGSGSSEAKQIPQGDAAVPTPEAA